MGMLLDSMDKTVYVASQRKSYVSFLVELHLCQLFDHW